MLTELRRILAELTGERAAKVAALEAITATAEGESRSLTVEEDAQFAAAIDEVKALDVKAEELRSRVADLEEIERNTQAANKLAPFNFNRGDLADPFDLSDLRYGAGREELQARVRSVLSEDRNSKTGIYLTGAERDRVEDLMNRVDTSDGRLARRILATGSQNYRNAWIKAVSGNEIAMTEAERGAVMEMRAATLTDTAGGYAIPFAVDTTMIDTGDHSVNPFRQVSTVRQTMNDVWQGVSSAGVTASFDAEGVEVSDDAPTLAAPTITTRMARAFVPFTIEIGMDWANMESDIRAMFAQAKDDLEATVFATGVAASNQPIGIVTALDGGSSEVAPTTAEAFAVADLYKVEEALPARYRGRASWVANKAIFNDIRQFGTADSHALWERLGAAQPAQLLGYPTYEASAMDNGFDAAVTADNFILILGDFSNYYIIDRVGMSVELIPHLFATQNNLPSGRRGLFAYWRVGADSVNDGGFRMLNIATTA